MNRFIQFSIAAAAALLLPACQPQYPMSPVLGGSLNPEDNAGIAVIGQSTEAGSNGGLFSKCAPLRSYWARLGHVPIGEPPGFTAAFNGCPERTEQPVAYNVMKIRPGTYLLKSATEQYGVLENTTTFDTGPILTFTIAKGEVIYLGDLVFAARKPHNLVAINRDDAAAQSALDKYKGVTTPLSFRAFTLQNRGNSGASSK